MMPGAELQAWAGWLEHGLSVVVNQFVDDVQMERRDALERLSERLDATADEWLPPELFMSPEHNVTVREQVKSRFRDILGAAAILRDTRSQALRAEAWHRGQSKTSKATA